MKKDIINFFSAHRQIFGLCPNPDCQEPLFRLSDAHVFLKEKPVPDWMDNLHKAEEKLQKLEERIESKKGEVRGEARDTGRRKALAAAKKVDPVFTPRKLNPDDAKVLFHPIDYVVFDGMKEKDFIKRILLLDREATNRDHAKTQRSIEKAVEKGNCEWRTLRVNPDGTITEKE